MSNVPHFVWEHLPDILQAMTTGLVFWAWWSIKKIFVTRADHLANCEAVNARLDALEESRHERAAVLADLENRLNSVLNEIDHRLKTVPTAEDTVNIGLAIKDLEGELKGIRAQQDGFAHIISRLEMSVDRFTEVHMR